MFLAFLIFDPNWPFCKAIAFGWAIAFARWPILKIFFFLKSWVLFARFFYRTTKIFCRMDFCMFLAFLIFGPNWPFCKAIAFGWAIAFARWPILKIFSFLESWVFFARFSYRTTKIFCRMVFRMFLAFLIFDPNWPFCKAIAFGWALAFARWPILKIFSFLESWVFFARFSHKTILIFL